MSTKRSRSVSADGLRSSRRSSLSGATEWVEEGEKPVVYVQGGVLASWLAELPEKLNAPERAAVITALKQVRAELAAAESAPSLARESA